MPRVTAAPTPAAVHGACCGAGPLLAGLGALTPLPSPPLTAPGPTPATGTIVVRGATVLPVDAAFTAAEALAVRDGRVLAVGDEADVLAAAGDEAEVIDRPGAVILPGFVEPHAHLLPTALFGPWEDVGAQRFSTVDGVIDRLADLVADRAPGQGWLLGRQFDPSLQAGPDRLTADLLDRASADVPIAVLNASLHFAYVNSAALRVAGITAGHRGHPGISVRPSP